MLPFYLLADHNIEKNPHVVYDVSVIEDHYRVQYTFRDPFNNLQNYSLNIPVDGANRMISKFGIPMWMFEPYMDTKENLEYRKQVLKDGLFRLSENTIEVDKSAVVEYYSESVCLPIARMIVRSLGEYGLDTPRNRVEFAMRFVQDIPYGIPTYEDESRHYGGVSPPPKLLIEGFGDCDSKVLLFAGIIAYLIPSEDFIFLNQQKHVLSAIKAAPEKGLTFVRFEGEKFLIAETAGPGKRMLGQEGHYFEEKFTPEKLYIKPREILAKADPSEKKSGVNPTAEQIDPKSIILQNASNKKIQFQISHDQNEWQNFDLEGNQSGQIDFEKGMSLFIRFRERNNFAVYRIITGHSYTFIWNNVKRKWEIQT
ncbi:MAG: hypothetical protein KDC09_04555 [Bacteroidales bacterium]|nr:hypothetical protein [Bacteroidales bacterium]